MPAMACSFLHPVYKHLTFIAKEDRVKALQSVKSYLLEHYESQLKYDLEKSFLKTNSISRSDTISDMQQERKKTKIKLTFDEPNAPSTNEVDDIYEYWFSKRE